VSKCVVCWCSNDSEFTALGIDLVRAPLQRNPSREQQVKYACERALRGGR
jgi:hypothetical protein